MKKNRKTPTLGESILKLELQILKAEKNPDYCILFDQQTRLDLPEARKTLAKLQERQRLNRAT